MSTSADSNHQLEEDSILEASSDKGSGSQDDSTDDGRPSCGFGPCRPRWLQMFAKPIWFMILLNVYCFVEGTIVTGKVNQWRRLRNFRSIIT